MATRIDPAANCPITGRTTSSLRPEVQHFPPRPGRDSRAPVFAGIADSDSRAPVFAGIADSDYLALEYRLLVGLSQERK